MNILKVCVIDYGIMNSLEEQTKSGSKPSILWSTKLKKKAMRLRKPGYL